MESLLQQTFHRALPPLSDGKGRCLANLCAEAHRECAQAPAVVFTREHPFLRRSLRPGSEGGNRVGHKSGGKGLHK